MILKNDHAVVKFSGATALHGFYWELSVGKNIALVGPNGSGKSTLLRTLSGILTPTSGEITLNGANVSTLPRLEASKKIAFLPQSSSYAFSMNVEEFVALGFHPELDRFAGLSTHQKKRQREALEWFDIVPFCDRAIHELSGGELQRVRLARTAVSQAPFFLLDEPTAPLDPKYVSRFFDFVRSDKTRATLVAIHDLSAVDGIFDEVLVLGAGEKIAAGVPDEALTDSLVSEVYGVSAESIRHKNRRFWVFGDEPRDTEENRSK